jgi:hypothetical protein
VFRRAVPPGFQAAFGTKEVFVTLRAATVAEARLAMQPHLDSFERKLRLASDGQLSPTISDTPDPSLIEIEAVVRQWLAERIERFAKLGTTPENEAEAVARLSELERYREDVEAGLVIGRPTRSQMNDWIVQAIKERRSWTFDERSSAHRNLRRVVAREAARSGTDGIRRVLDFIKERVGSGERDPLMPKTLSKLTPVEIAAAKSVASAIRSLSEREAAFDAVQLTKTALDLGLPITVDEVEKRIAALERQGKLVRGVDGNKDRLTTPQAIDTEKGILGFVEAGRGKGDRVIDSPQAAGERLQAAAMADKGFALNPGQEAAGRLVLAGTDRIVAVQGVAGAGKSSALGAMAIVAREEGRNVVGLGLQNTLVRMLERDTGIASMTIARFLGTHGRLLDDRTSPQRLDMAREMFRGSILLVDEASMVSNDQVLKLTALAQRLEVGKLAFVGDKAAVLASTSSCRARPLNLTTATRDGARPRSLTAGLFGFGSVSSVDPCGMMNRITQVPLPPICITGAVMAIFSLAAAWVTGAVIAMLRLAVLPPKI